jgi:DNA helicase-2/ATP-dependent DNA helicase PcrA
MFAHPWREGLDEAQLAAAAHGDGPLVVVAGAGTGKTRVLTARVASLLERGVAPERILLLTFTRRAADEMLSRAAALVGRGDIAGRLRGGTFHAVAYQVLCAWGEALGLQAGFSLLDQADAAEVMDLVRDEHGLSGTEERAPTPATLVEIYSRCVNTGRPLGEVVAADFPWCEPHREAIAAVCKAYLDHKRGRSQLDFDDLLLYWRAALTDERLSGRLSGAFDHVLVDEWQDVNGLQADIVALLRPGGRGLTVVGDDAQAIYGFRGGDAARLEELAASLPDATVVRLERNFRSFQPILDVANEVRPPAMSRGAVSLPGAAAGYRRAPGAASGHAASASAEPVIGAPAPLGALGDGWRGDGWRGDGWSAADLGGGSRVTLRAARQGGRRPLFVRCYDAGAEARAVVERILERHDRGRRLLDQAVLVRSGHHSDLVELELSARGVPYRKFGGLRFLEAAHVKDFLAVARLIGNPADDVAWFRLLRMHEGIGPTRARQLLASLTPKYPLATPSWSEALAAAPEVSRAALAATFRGLSTAREAGTPGAKAEGALSVLRPLLAARFLDVAPRLNDLERLAATAATAVDFSSWLAGLALDPPASTSDFAGPPQLDDDYVTISTVHSAKGLEWPVVHLIHLVDGAFPSDMALRSRQGLEEEQRLFYVGVTRARDELLLYCPLRMPHRRRGLDDRHSFAQQSRWLDEAVVNLLAVEEVSARPGGAVCVAGGESESCGGAQGAQLRPAVAAALNLEHLWR